MRATVLILTCLWWALCPSAAVAQYDLASTPAPVVTVCSVTSLGTPGNQDSIESAISHDGSRVAFSSASTNLDGGGTRGRTNIYLRDLASGETRLVSKRPDGRPARYDCVSPDLSADGRFVVFSSLDYLDPADRNPHEDVFVHDLVSGRTTLVSAGMGGAPANLDSGWPQISADGRFVVFWSRSSNLVAWDTNRIDDIFVRDMLTGVTERVSLGTADAQIEGLADSMISTMGWRADISDDGRYVLFDCRSAGVEEDTNGAYDVFLRDRLAGTTLRVSVAADGHQGEVDSWYSALSGDGRHVVFESADARVVPRPRPPDLNNTTIVWKDLDTGESKTLWVPAEYVGFEGASAYGGEPSVSYDGSRVAFSVRSVVESDPGSSTADIAVIDVASGTYRYANRTAAGPPNGESYLPQISGDGRHVAYWSEATDLAQVDGNAARDVFAADLEGATTSLIPRPRVSRPSQTRPSTVSFDAIGAPSGTLALQLQQLRGSVWLPAAIQIPAGGARGVQVPAADSRQVYRLMGESGAGVRFLPQWFTVVPTARLTRPSASLRVERDGDRFGRITGRILPRHRGVVQVHVEKLVGTRWVEQRSLRESRATTADGVCTVYVSLGKGRYRFRTSHGSASESACHSQGWSPYSAVLTVR